MLAELMKLHKLLWVLRCECTSKCLRCTLYCSHTVTKLHDTPTQLCSTILGLYCIIRYSALIPSLSVHQHVLYIHVLSLHAIHMPMHNLHFLMHMQYVYCYVAASLLIVDLYWCNRLCMCMSMSLFHSSLSCWGPIFTCYPVPT